MGRTNEANPANQPYDRPVSKAAREGTQLRQVGQVGFIGSFQGGKMQNDSGREKGFESVQRAREGNSIANDLAVIQGFADRGIVATPRDDVFTFWGWKALGRSVKKGEHGVKVTVWITKANVPDPNQQPGEISTRRAASYPKSSTVFHFSQTEPDRFVKKIEVSQ